MCYLQTVSRWYHLHAEAGVRHPETNLQPPSGNRVLSIPNDITENASHIHTHDQQLK